MAVWAGAAARVGGAAASQDGRAQSRQEPPGMLDAYQTPAGMIIVRDKTDEQPVAGCIVLGRKTMGSGSPTPGLLPKAIRWPKWSQKLQRGSRNWSSCWLI
jgi:hypothetical protein